MADNRPTLAVEKVSKKRPKEANDVEESKTSKKRKLESTNKLTKSEDTNGKFRKSTSVIPVPVSPQTLPTRESKPAKKPKSHAKSQDEPAKKPQEESPTKSQEKSLKKPQEELQEISQDISHRKSTSIVPLPTLQPVEIENENSIPEDPAKVKRKKKRESQKEKKVNGHINGQSETIEAHRKPESQEQPEQSEQHIEFKNKSKRIKSKIVENKFAQTIQEDIHIDDEIYGPIEMPENHTNTGLELITAKLYLPVPPIAIKYSLQGAIADAISPLLLTYHPPFKGVVLGHQNARPANENDASSRCIDSYGQSFLWVIVEVLIFRPLKGVLLEGYISLQSETHITLTIWNFFSARIERKRIPPNWKFVRDDEAQEMGSSRRKYKSITGTYYDHNDNKIEGQQVFRSIDFDISMGSGAEKSIISIEGSFLTEQQEKIIQGKRNLRLV